MGGGGGTSVIMRPQEMSAEAGLSRATSSSPASTGRKTLAIQSYEIELAIIEQRQLDPPAHIRDVRLIEDHLGCVLPVVLEFAILRRREDVVRASATVRRTPRSNGPG